MNYERNDILVSEAARGACARVLDKNTVIEMRRRLQRIISDELTVSVSTITPDMNEYQKLWIETLAEKNEMMRLAKETLAWLDAQELELA